MQPSQVGQIGICLEILAAPLLTIDPKQNSMLLAGGNGAGFAVALAAARKFDISGV